ncbi:MAG TPA: ABC transporter permease [Solirubrobacterales bacterium]|nr:ABC transporter permease [Solirubrobacterales bacterium]
MSGEQTTISRTPAPPALGGPGAPGVQRTGPARQWRVESPWRLALRRFFRHRLAAIGLVLVVLLLGSALLAPLLAPRNPDQISILDKFVSPLHGGYLLGADELGRDLLSRLLYAGRISLVVGFAAMVVTVSVGTVVGLLAGYLGGWVDTVLMRVTDALLCFPTIFLLLILASFVGASLLSITLIIGLTAWMELARILRNQTLALRERDFVQAAEALGASHTRILVRHLLPNSLAPILVAATLNVANAVLAESYISYLGYGIQPPTASWGNMLNNAQGYFGDAPWIALFPGLLITLTVTGFNFIGDGLRDALDPRTRR